MDLTIHYLMGKPRLMEKPMAKPSGKPCQKISVPAESTSPGTARGRDPAIRTAD